MRYSLYDSMGNLISGGSSSSVGGQSPAPGTSSMITLPIDFGHYWNTNYSANTNVPFAKAVVNQNGFTIGTADAQWQASMSGNIISLAMYEAGPAAGSHVVQIQINGNVVNTTTMGTGGNGTYFKQAVTIPYNLGDVVKAYVSNSASGNTQSQLAFSIQYSS